MSRTLTNEEKRVVYYAQNNKPTDPKLVNNETPLDSLNLNWREKDLPERERTKHVHRLHPYLGKYIPQLVEIFLRKYFKPKQTVLDPFCGSGTTLVQANELNIHSIGYDISKFNVLLSQVKTAEYDVDLLDKEVKDSIEKLRGLIGKLSNELQFEEIKELDPSLHTNTDTDNEYLKTWFAPQALKELLLYHNLIETQSYKYADVMKIILSRSARSARQTTHFDLDFPKKPVTNEYWCYKHSRMCRPTKEAYKFIRRYSVDTLRRIKEYSMLRTKADVKVFNEDSRTASFPAFDGIITSPPYVGLIDYHEQHAYGYHLLNLEDQREKEIGPASNGANGNARLKYQEDITTVFKNAANSVKPGSRFIVIAGDRHNLYDSIAEGAGLEVESIIQRHVNRRTGRRSTEFYESIFVWRKP